MLFCDRIAAAGEEWFALACKNDLEGIVAKHQFGPDLPDIGAVVQEPQPEILTVDWRENFFERERGR